MKFPVFAIYIAEKKYIIYCNVSFFPNIVQPEQPVSCLATLNLPICPPSGDAVGSDPASSGSRSGPREDGAGARFDACGPRQGPKPGDDGSQRNREPHGGGPQTQSSRYFGGHSGGEGRANAALCGEDCYSFYVLFIPGVTRITVTQRS